MQKVRKSFCWGSQDILALWPFAEGLFYFLELFYTKRRIFKKYVIYVI
jgi:hypothetical protein